MNHEELASVVATLPRVTSATVTNASAGWIEVTARLNGGGSPCHLRIELASSFSTVRSRIKLLDLEPPHLAHVNPEGTVCVDEGGGLASDLDAPGDVASWWLEGALDVLEKSYAQAARGEFEPLMEELAGYWSSLEGGARVELLDAPTTEPRRIRGFECQGELSAVSFGHDGSERRHVSRHRLAQHDRVAVAFLPLSVPVLPPARGAMPDARFVRAAIEAQPPSLRTRLKETVRCLPRRGRFRHYLLQQSVSGGAKNLVGLSVKVKRRAGDPILDESVRGKPRPWATVHHYRAYQLPRGGALTALESKRVVIVGCGSLGGELARLLAQSGVGELLLIDPDVYSIDNVHRHALSPDHIGMKKTVALREVLEARFSGIRVRTLESVVQRAELQLFSSSPDLICLATGEPNVERDLVRRRLSCAATPPFLSGWIEPLSLGGHLVVSRHGTPGCLECNFLGTTGAPDLAGQVSFLGSGQSVQRSLAGCAGAFTPYTVADAVQTAALMAHAAQDLLLGHFGPFYRFWRGSSHQALAEGVRTSGWYDRSACVASELAAAALANAQCPVCAPWRR